MANLLIFFVFLGAELALSSARSCVDVSYLSIHPIDCCVYPRIFKDEELESKCRKECESKKEPHCARVCYLHDIGAYLDKKFHPEAMKSVFENNTNDTKKAREKSQGPLDDAWKDIIDESIKLCDKEYPHNAEINEKKLPEYVKKYTTCLRMNNYLSCPDMVSSKDCDEVKDLIKTCDKNTHDLLFGAFHENRKHLQQEGGKHSEVAPGSGSAKH